MKNAIFLLMVLGALALSGCANEKSFEVTGALPRSPMREESAAQPKRVAKPQKIFPSAQRTAVPFPETNPAAMAPAPKKIAVKPPVEPGVKTEQPKVTIVPETSLQGKVVRANASLRFVVLNFPVGRMAAVDQQFNIYRQGAKVGSAKVTGPQQDDNIIADIVEGEAEVGDEVREN